MVALINTERLEKHTVQKYNFKVLGNTSSDTSDEEFISSLVSEETSEEETYTEEDNPNRRESDGDSEIDSSLMSKSSKEALIESLMKKTDEMSSNFIKLQMKLESKEEEYKTELEKVKEEAYNTGLEAGIQKVADDSQKDLTKGIEQFSTSVSTLEKSAKDYESALESIKSELISAAVDISKEVINTELSENSSEVAKILGDSLIKELQSASKITLKVNPSDHGAISQHLGSLEHIQIVSDGAVSEGGVIALSDAGNIDSQISKRFERVKRAALGE